MLLIASTLAIILLFLIRHIIKCRQLPSGPIGLPFIGYYPFLGVNPAKTITDLSRKYGDILTINILGDNYWFLNSFEAVEEAFVKNGELFTDRALSREYNMYSITSSNTIGGSEGNVWKITQRFTVGKLAFLGMGKSEFEFKIQSFLDKVVNYVDSKKGNANDYFEILTNLSLNIITTLTINKHYEYNDPQGILLVKWAHNIFASFEYLNLVLSGFGFKVLMTLFPENVKKIDKNRTELRNFVEAIIDERMEIFDENKCNDLLDYFLKETSGENGQLFHRKAISAKIMELLFTGTDTVSATLYHSLRLMSLNQAVQERIFTEINSIYGTNGNITYTERHRLPYTLAVISEIHRFICLAPLPVSHSNREATKLGPYFVPKRQKVVPNLYAISRNPRYYKNPNEFDPGNFLDSSGGYLPNKALIPFSTGIRKCLGKTLAEIEIFLTFTRLMQLFHWKQPDFGADEKVSVSVGLIGHLAANKVCALRRL